MRKLKIPITIILLLAISLSLLPPNESNAQVEPQSITGSIVSGVACTIGGAIAPFLIDKIVGFLQKLYLNLPGWIADFLGMGFFNALFNADEVPVGDSQIRNKEHFGDVIARCGALVLLDTVSQRTIAGVRTSGRDGGPAFVRNWRRFKFDAQQRGEDIFRAILGSTELCPYFAGDVRAIFKASNQPDPNIIGIRANNLDPYTLRGRCTMPNGWSLENFATNFAATGGWEALRRLSQPQNNYYGTLIMANSELHAQRSTEDAVDTIEAITGRGFESRRGNYKDDNCLLTASNGQCILYKDITSPGSYISDTVANIAQQELAWITNTDEISELIANLTVRFINRLLDLSGERPDSDIYGYPTREGIPELIDNFDIPSGGGGTIPTPTPTPIPSNLPDSTAAFTICNDGATAPNATNTCLTAQWARQGGTVAQAIDPSGVCMSSNCVVLNHKIAGTPTTAYIDRANLSLGGSARVSTLTGAPDYPEGTRIDTCMTDGALSYLLFVAGLQGIQVPLTVPTGGGGNCSSTPPLQGNEECFDSLDNDGDGLIDYGNDPECFSPGDTNEAF